MHTLVSICAYCFSELCECSYAPCLESTKPDSEVLVLWGPPFSLALKLFQLPLSLNTLTSEKRDLIMETSNLYSV